MKKLLTLFINLKFRKKLFISYLVVCIIPVVVLGMYSFQQANDFLRQQVKQGLNESVRQIADNISFRCNQYESIINSITYNFRFQQIFSSDYQDFSSLYRDYVDPFFSNILNFNKDVLQISVFTNNKKILRGEFILPIILLKDRPWFAKALNAKQTEWYAKNGKLICMRRFSGEYAKDNEPAVLFINIDTDSLFNGIYSIKSPAYGVYILDENGEKILSRNNHIKDLPDIGGLMAANAGASSIKIKNKDFLLVKAELPEAGWMLFYFTPVDAISIDARKIVIATAAIAGICIIAMVFLIWIFSSTFVKRINNLNSKMEIVESGDLKIDVTCASKDEIGELTNRFGKMLNYINSLIDEVYHSKLTQKDSELKALQAQINPHFLYNTLSIINWKAIRAGEMEISDITNTISRFYRTVLNKGKNIISVKDEADNAKAYMEIQLIMHNHNFDFEYKIDESLYEDQITNLIFQPILENAIEHGIDRKREDEGRGMVVLTGSTDGYDMVFAIEDNGPGMAEEFVEKMLTQDSKGYGLKNVHERIRIFFGSPYGIEIKSKIGAGTIVTIKIPMNKK